MNLFFAVFILSVFTILAGTALAKLFAKPYSNFDDALEIVQIASPLIGLVFAGIITAVIYGV